MKLEDLEKARKAQQQSDRHVYFDDVGNIIIMVEQSPVIMQKVIMLFLHMSNVKSLKIQKIKKL